MQIKLSIFLIVFFSFTCSVYSSEWDYHTTRIPTDDIEDFSPRVPKINDLGNVVFNNFGYDIYFWNRSSLSQIYSNDKRISFGALNINNSNDMVWDEGSLFFDPPAYIFKRRYNFTEFTNRTFAKH